MFARAWTQSVAGDVDAWSGVYQASFLGHSLGELRFRVKMLGKTVQILMFWI